jgi:hypothetical protein
VGADKFTIRIGAIYLEAVRVKGYGFSSERSDAREYSIDRAEQIAGDMVARGFAKDLSTVVIEKSN